MAVPKPTLLHLKVKAPKIQSRAQTPFGKIEKGSGNTAIQCFVLCGP